MKKSTDASARKPKLVGVNHIALEVGDVEAALAFYGKIFDFTLRGKGKGQAFIDMGDQFIALMETKTPHHDAGRHFGIVVDDRSAVKALAAEAGAKLVDGPFMDFLDPWGNRFEVIDYRDIQFTKAPHVLRAWGWRSRRVRRRAASSRTRACRPSRPESGGPVPAPQHIGGLGADAGEMQAARLGIVQAAHASDGRCQRAWNKIGTFPAEFKPRQVRSRRRT